MATEKSEAARYLLAVRLLQLLGAVEDLGDDPGGVGRLADMWRLVRIIHIIYHYLSIYLSIYA